MINILRRTLFFNSKPKIPTSAEVRQNWNQFSHQYNTFNAGPQTFYYTLSTMLKIQEAQNILQVACGTGKLLPFMLNVKKSSASYLASDIAPNMVGLAKENLRNYFEKYESRLSFDQWCSKQNLSFDVLDAEQPLNINRPFDRIICNCALMITSDARKMLTNLHAHSKPGCLFGVNVWGDKNKNNLMMSIRDAILESGYELPQERSNFHLYKKVPALAEQTGWEVVASWEQNVPFPVIQYQPEKNRELFHYQLNKLPEHQRPKIKQRLEEKITKIFEEKRILNFAVEMFVLRRK